MSETIGRHSMIHVHTGPCWWGPKVRNSHCTLDFSCIGGCTTQYFTRQVPIVSKLCTLLLTQTHTCTKSYLIHMHTPHHTSPTHSHTQNTYQTVPHTHITHSFHTTPPHTPHSHYTSHTHHTLSPYYLTHTHTHTHTHTPSTTTTTTISKPDID